MSGIYVLTKIKLTGEYRKNPEVWARNLLNNIGFNEQTIMATDQHNALRFPIFNTPTALEYRRQSPRP